MGVAGASGSDPGADGVILFSGAALASSTPYLSLATQPALANCRITVPVMRMAMRRVMTPWGPAWVPSLQFVGIGLDCSLPP